PHGTELRPRDASPLRGAGSRPEGRAHMTLPGRSALVVRRWTQTVLPPIVPLLVVAAATELAVRRCWVPSYLVPAPSKVLQTLFSRRDGGELLRAAGQTALAAFLGFAASAVLGQ